MGLFGKKETDDQELCKTDMKAISSLIDQSMCITGTIIFKGKTRIDGTVTGNIEGEHLILSETGKINGNVQSISFNCYGTLEGDIQANNVIARKNCSIHGKLEASNLTVEPGAAIDGEIKAAVKDVRQTTEKQSLQISSPPKTPIPLKSHG
jgi:cytoskeletal protein CcmA (bactofilin family)